MNTPNESENPLNNATYENIIRDMQGLYQNKLPPCEAHESARNFIGWMQTLLEIERDRKYNRGYEHSD